jgi:hypothetical protein
MSKKVIEEPTKLTESHKQLLPKVNFDDTFSTTNHINNIQEITNLIFNSTPKWVNSLFVIRNKIVGLFGLKTEIPEGYTEEFKVGGFVKFFEIYSIKENEIVLGANDSHLNFRAIVTNDNSELFNIKVITLVEYNNTMGKIYMGIIKPFHRLVVKKLVGNAFIDSTKFEKQIANNKSEKFE